MRRSVLLLAVPFLLASVRPVAAEDRYTIRLHEPSAGDTCRIEKDETLVEKVHYRDMLGRTLAERNHAAGEVSIYAETVLAREANQPASRLRRTYQKAWTREGGRLKPLVYDGRTVLIERKQGKYSYFLTGRGELTAAEANFLEREFNGRDERFGLRHLMPADPVRPGNYPWAVDMAPLVQDLGRTRKLVADPLRAKGSGQLQRVWRGGDGRLLGEFRFQLEMPMSAVKLGRNRVALQPGGKAVSDMTLELCIDGSAFHLTQRSTTRIAATGPFQSADGSVGLVAVMVQAESTGLTQQIPRK